jgi:hypothetical protein
MTIVRSRHDLLWSGEPESIDRAHARTIGPRRTNNARREFLKVWPFCNESKQTASKTPNKTMTSLTAMVLSRCKVWLPAETPRRT